MTFYGVKIGLLFCVNEPQTLCNKNTLFYTGFYMILLDVESCRTQCRKAYFFA